jgi:hypothetical protein
MFGHHKLVRDGAQIEGVVLGIPVRYDPSDRRKLVIDVPALHDRALAEWTKAREADRARAEAVLAGDGPRMERRTSTRSRSSMISIEPARSPTSPLLAVRVA